jgi:predicted phosphodiesterase
MIKRIIENPELASTLDEDETIELLKRAESIIQQEPNLLEIPSGNVIFVGDTHGDFDATKIVIKRYLKPPNKIVFLGDYVDRGTDSKQNIDYLLALKTIYPERLLLLQGNHEGRKAMYFSPANFWQELSPVLSGQYAETLSKLPYAVSTSNGIIALHGALPSVSNLQAIKKIEFGSELWRQIAWGDWQESNGDVLGDEAFTGRPQFGATHFKTIMKRLGKNVLIRSHQPTAKLALYQKRCVTIFTSSAYLSIVPTRTIAIADLEKDVRTIDDLSIKEI